MDSRVTDSNLIDILNAKAGINASSQNSITDPNLIAQLNAKAGISTSHRPMSAKDQMNKFYAENPTSIEHKNGMQELSDFIVPPNARDGIKKALGYGIMGFAPEATLIPKAVGKYLPELAGVPKLIKDYASSVAKVGGATYAGEKIMPNTTNEDAKNAALQAGGLTAGVSPIMMALASSNPLTRLGLGSLGGAGIGYILGQETGAPKTTASIGGLMGGLGSFGRAGGKQLAAQNMAKSLTPNQVANATDRTFNSGQLGIPLTLAEKTGSPILSAMQDNAASSVSGSKILHNFGVNRQKAEESAIEKFLQQVSPNNAYLTKEKDAFKNSFENAEKKGVKININPVTDYINNELKGHEPGSKIALALNQAKNRLSMTPRTSEQFQKTMSPIDEIEKHLNNKVSDINNKLNQLKDSAPDSYFKASSGYDNQINQLQSALEQHQNMLNKVQEGRNEVVKTAGYNGLENTLEGLHNAKLGIRGIIESQGDNAIGNTAAGKLKNVNKLLNKQLTSASPAYNEANKISNLRQARDQIEKAMAKSSLSGSNFYDKVLSNKLEYNKLYQRLGDINKPEQITMAQRNLDAMNKIFPDLMDNLSNKTSKAIAKESGGFKFSVDGVVKSLLNKVYLDRYNKGVAQLLVDPQWHSEIIRLAKMPKGEDRGIQLGRLISKVAAMGNAATNQTQGSKSYVTE